MKSVYALLIATAVLGGCKKGGEASPNTGKGAQAKEMLAAWTKAGADHAALTTGLRPKPDDYAAVFVGDAAQKMKAGLDPLWDGGKLTLKPKPSQTEIDVVGAGQGELVKGEGAATGCPPAYKTVADKIKPNTVVYCFRWKEPGEKGGLHVDGLVWVNDHWALFPKPWRFLGGSPSAAPGGSAKP